MNTPTVRRIKIQLIITSVLVILYSGFTVNELIAYGNGDVMDFLGFVFPEVLSFLPIIISSLILFMLARPLRKTYKIYQELKKGSDGNLFI